MESKNGPENIRCLNALQLKLIAMVLMLCDHIRGTPASFISIGK